VARRTLLARIGLGFLVAFLAGIPASYAFIEWSVQPSFCTNCHLMDPYYKSWKESSHGKAGVACIECHYEPGVVETARGKVMALNMVVKYFTGAEGTKPWAEVSDASCMRGGCHSQRLLAGEVRFDVGKVSIPFNHTPHLLEMRGSKKLRCTSCHSQIVQGEHLTVTSTTCFLCHFKGAAQDPKLSDCGTCHGAPEKPIDLPGGFVYDHADYVGRGVKCESCHAGTTRGTGEVPRHRCSSCHGVVEHLERYGDTEFLHRKHVTDHKVECLQCHTEITHRLRGKAGEKDPDAAATAAPATGAAGCDACHQSSHGASEAFYRGEGGRGAPPTPSAMWLARVDCGGCHLRLPGSKPTARGAVPAREVACLSCHGPGFEGILGRWQSAFGPAMDSVGAEVEKALAAAEAAGESGAAKRKGLEDARHDVALLKADGSRGVHNPWYARRLLDAAHAAAAEAEHTLRPGDPPAASPLDPPFATKMSCALLCHVGIQDRDIRREGTRFEHRKHVGKTFDCDACHSSGGFGRPGETHGEVHIANSDCCKCHHGATPPSPAASRTCASCHVEADRFLRGLHEDGSEGPQMMANVACDACHGAPPEKPVLAVVQPRCIQCHKQDPSYGEMAADWAKDAAGWRTEAEARLAKVRAKARVKGGAAADALAAAEAVLRRLRFEVPAHNILLFEEEKDAFGEAASAAEKAAR
jgi:nitrate/TMAO reductase-like tetraheme cytochrome c subunit